MPSIARNDPAFKDQEYWRGRIWPPMNYLVWLGLENYRSTLAKEAREDLARRSLRILMDEWRTKGHIHENYSGIDGENDPAPNSDRFYFWGGLLGLPSLALP